MKQCKTEGCDSTDLATRSSLCKAHHREYVREHYRANKASYVEKAKKRNAEVKEKHREIIMEHLRGNPCVDCGNSDTEVLQFDHRDRSDKVSEVSNLITGSTRRLMDEIEKCDIRCANCHVKRTRRQMGYWHNGDVSVDAALLVVKTTDVLS